jgi:hypothetical protein
MNEGTPKATPPEPQITKLQRALIALDVCAFVGCFTLFVYGWYHFANGSGYYSLAQLALSVPAIISIVLMRMPGTRAFGQICLVFTLALWALNWLTLDWRPLGGGWNFD